VSIPAQYLHCIKGVWFNGKVMKPHSTFRVLLKNRGKIFFFFFLTKMI